MVTLITRPQRFGKTLNMSMVEAFFSVQYQKRKDLFDGLKVWERKNFRKQPGRKLGLMAELSGRYVLSSNRKSGFGRDDVMLEPKQQRDDGILLEFKVQDPDGEKVLIGGK